MTSLPAELRGQAVYNELISFTSYDVNSWFLKYRSALELGKRINFDQPSSLTNIDYYNLTGLIKQQFNKLVLSISNSSLIHESINYSIRTAIDILLCKLRLGLSNHVLSSLFQLNDRKVVSHAIASATKALMANFVPNNVGFNHIDRDNIIKNHTTTIARELIGGGKDVAILLADGTYLYIQVSFNNSYPPEEVLLYVL
ncbi:unnamed protein product [Didymodactylos carnosus]|uniref:Uncharacterized protein n=1 Tax=Didymodactylos carnosus TaxID=1234261 RepID=A0A8S2DJ87_9BILA|nr:unnamed protein product [Didymodactylos carnosus]CAF3716579.1 unnamed protein product [Didymodactylos carnosus]